jgi:hypothetical protein
VSTEEAPPRRGVVEEVRWQGSRWLGPARWRRSLEMALTRTSEVDGSGLERWLGGRGRCTYDTLPGRAEGEEGNGGGRGVDGAMRGTAAEEGPSR